MDMMRLLFKNMDCDYCEVFAFYLVILLADGKDDSIHILVCLGICAVDFYV